MHHRRFFWTLQRMRHAPILIPSGFIGITIAAWGMHVRNDDCGISSRAYDLGSRLIVTHHMHQGICDSIRFRYSQCRDIRFAFLFIGLFVDQSIHTRLLLWMRGLRPRWRSRPVQLLSEEFLEFVEESHSVDWTLHFQGSLARAMVPTSLVEVRALVGNEIKRCMAHNRAFSKQISLCSNLGLLVLTVRTSIGVFWRTLEIGAKAA